MRKWLSLSIIDKLPQSSKERRTFLKYKQEGNGSW
jgi:hypothetical protein